MKTADEVLNKIIDLSDKRDEYTKNNMYILELESTYERIVNLMNRETTNMDSLDKHKLLCELKREVISVINKYMYFSEGPHLHAIINEVKDFITEDISNTKTVNSKILEEITAELA